MRFLSFTLQCLEFISLKLLTEHQTDREMKKAFFFWEKESPFE